MSHAPRSLRTTLAWAGIGALGCAAMVPLEPNLLEEGALLHFAERMAHGERLYRDIASFTGPLPSAVLSWSFALFGEDLRLARGLVAVLHGAATAAVFRLAWRARAGALAHAAAAAVAAAPALLFPFFSMYFYTTLAFSLACVCAALAARGASEPRWAAAAGLGVALVALSKQTLGAALAAALGAALLAAAPGGRRLHCAGAFAGAGAAVTLGTLALYAARGELALLVDALLAQPTSFGAGFASPLPPLWPPGDFGGALAGQDAYYLPSQVVMLRARPGPALVALAQAAFALPAFALGATAFRVAQRARTGRLGSLPPALWMHTALLAAMCTNLLPRADWGHLVVALPPALSQLLLLTPQAHAPGADRAAGGGRRAVLGALLAGGVLAAGLALGTALWRVSGPPGFGPRVPLRPVSEPRPDRGVAPVIRYLRAHVAPGEAIFVPRAEPLLYFATQTVNPTPYPGVLPTRLDEQQRRIRAALPHVRFVAMSERDSPLYTYYADLLPGVQQDLERHFAVVRSLFEASPGWLVLLRPAPDRGALLADLVRTPRREWSVDAAGVRGPPALPAPRLAARLNRRPVPVVVGPGGGGFDVALRVPPAARLQVDVGLAFASAARGRAVHVSPALARVRITRAAAPEAWETLLRARIDPIGPDARERWQPLEAPLGRYAGEAVVLRFEITPQAPLAGPTLGWFGSPRIAGPPASAAERAAAP